MTNNVKDIQNQNEKTKKIYDKVLTIVLFHFVLSISFTSSVIFTIFMHFYLVFSFIFHVMSVKLLYLMNKPYFTSF